MYFRISDDDARLEIEGIVETVSDWISVANETNLLRTEIELMETAFKV